MAGPVRAYFAQLSEQFGGGWNRFWFRRSDALPLCVMRILVGLVALYALLTFSLDLEQLFGPGGLLPYDLIARLQGNELAPTYLGVGSMSLLWTLHALGIVVVGLFTFGLFTRVTSVLALVVMISYVNRAPLITGPLEPVLTMLLFFLCLAPCGAYLSLDAWRAKRAAASGATKQPWLVSSTEPSVAVNVATRLIQLHTALIYLMMGLSKLATPGATDVWWSGDAVWLLMVRPDARLIDLTWIFRGHDYLIHAWTHAIMLFEMAFPLLVWNRLARPLLLAVAVPMWLSLALITALTPFCLIMLTANLAFVSPLWLRGMLGLANKPGAPEPAVSS